MDPSAAIQADNLNKKRLPTGIAGLDTLLAGGLFCGGIYMVAGRPGAGKTLLANQICFNHVARGGRACYLTLLTESHARMMASLSPMSYFDPKVVGDSMLYLGAYTVLESEGFTGLLTMVRQQVRSLHSTLLVIDGLSTAVSLSSSDLDIKKFLHELQILLELMGCTAILLSGEMSSHEQYPLQTMVDGLIGLTTHQAGMHVARIIEVNKHRGAGQLMGKHCFDITDDGLIIYPRPEAVAPPTATPDDLPDRFLSSGSPAFDEVLGGGFMAATSSLLIGPPGAGKSMLGLSFLLAGEAAHEASVYVGASKSGPVAAAAAQAVARGHLHIFPLPDQEQTIDRYLSDLMALIDRHQIRRLFIGNAAQLRAAMVFNHRSRNVFRAMGRMLQARGVTTLIAEAHSVESGNRLEIPPTDVGSIAQSLVLMRYVEIDGHYKRYIAVLETPGFVHDDRVYSFHISPAGIALDEQTRPSQPRKRTQG